MRKSHICPESNKTHTNYLILGDIIMMQNYLILSHKDYLWVLDREYPRYCKKSNKKALDILFLYLKEKT